MACELKEPFWILVDHWQTMIAGIMALMAGFGTIWATIRAANQEIVAANKQIHVAQQQITTAQEKETRDVCRSIVCEFNAFWYFMENSDVLGKISNHTIRNEHNVFNPMRLHLSDEWLVLIRSSPNVLGILPNDISARIAVCYARTRSCIGRMNWMCRADRKDQSEWNVFSQKILDEFKAMKVEKDALIQELVKRYPPHNC